MKDFFGAIAGMASMTGGIISFLYAIRTPSSEEKMHKAPMKPPPRNFGPAYFILLALVMFFSGLLLFLRSVHSGTI